jgi:hypothetical protein
MLLSKGGLAASYYSERCEDASLEVRTSQTPTGLPHTRMGTSEAAQRVSGLARYFVC